MSSAACIIPLLVAIINRRYVKAYFVPLMIFLIVSLIVEILNKIYMELGINNYHIFHLFTVLEFSLISLFYSRFFKQYFNPLLIKLLIFLFLIVAFMDYRVNGLSTIDNFSISVESIILTFYSLFLFYYTLKNLIFESVLASPVFWINTAILIYFAGNLLLFVFSNYLLTTDPVDYDVLWTIIHSFFNIVYNVLLAIGFWKIRVK